MPKAYQRATKADRFDGRTTTIRLPVSLRERLARVSAERGIPKSEIIRAGVDGELLRLELAAPAPEARP